MIQWLQDWWRGNLLGARSGQWSSVSGEFLKQNPLCEVCGCKSKFLKTNQIHHEKPFHLFPELELRTSNLITLCPPHHLLVGHLMLWKSYNEHVRLDAELWNSKIRHRP